MNRGRNGMFPEGRLEGHDLSSNGGGEVMQRRPKWIKLRPVVKKKTKKQKTVESESAPQKRSFPGPAHVQRENEQLQQQHIPAV